MFRFWLAIGILGSTGLLGSFVFAPKAAFDTKPAKFTAYELAMVEDWPKGIAPVAAGNFDSVVLKNVSEDGEASLDLDKTLNAMYNVVADYSELPIDERYTHILQLLQIHSYFETETFCNLPGSKYCPVTIAWDSESDGQFTTLRVSERGFGIVADNLLQKWGFID